jgi:hypothetical protein
VANATCDCCFTGASASKSLIYKGATSISNINEIRTTVRTFDEFPGTLKKASELEGKLEVYFELASRLLSAWLRRPYSQALESSQLDVHVLNLAILLDIQATRQFRTVVTLCQIGEGQNAEIVARALFETVIATNFVFEPISLVVKANQRRSPNASTNPDQWTVRVAGENDVPTTLSLKTRAQVYLAHNIRQRQRSAQSLAAEYNRVTGKHLEPRVDWPTDESLYEEIGIHWMSIQSNRPYTYSGLNLKNLSAASGGQFPFWYDALYSDLSRSVHSVDALACLAENLHSGECVPGWFSCDEIVWCALFYANLLFCWHIHIMDRHFDFGPEMKSKVSKLKGGVASLYFSRRDREG